MQGTVKRGQFGFTNSIADLEAVRAWRDAAIADGWSHRPTYGNSEAEDRACSLERDGFKAMVLTRTPTGDRPSKWRAEAEVNIWGPDGLAITPPNVYDWQAIQAGALACSGCNASPVKTTRVGFAGRVCESCLPEMRAKIETTGWCN